MKRLLLAWSDRGIDGVAPAHQARRPASDRGPVLRLLEQPESEGRYSHATLLSVPGGVRLAGALADDVRAHGVTADVRAVRVDDPSDFAALFRELGLFLGDLARDYPRDTWEIDVLLSSGTPQAQTLWVIFVQAQMLAARMLQIIPAAFVPVPHPKAVRVVKLDIEGFPEIRSLREEVARLRAEGRARNAKIIGSSAAMQALLERIVRVGRSDLSVLVLGETGTGKELVARAVHDGSARASGPFIAESCGAFAEGVLASELFGHEAGAFTGATHRHRGLFEQAHGGTIFLDEVGEMAPRVQAMLLRVLQEGKLRRVGAEKVVSVDVRVVAATHRDLPAMVEAGTFREDLYYRLRGATLHVPPLRERVGDIPALVRSFLSEAHAARGKHALTVTPEAMHALARYAWPGNVRELRSVVQSWPVFCDERVDLDALPPEIRAGAAGMDDAPPSKASPRSRRAVPIAPLADVVAAAERAAVTRALAAFEGNLSQTAEALGIERNTLKRKLRAMGLYPDR